MQFEVVEEEGPFRRAPPPIAPAGAIEIDGERRDQIELSSKIGQRFVRPDRPNPAFDAEQIEQLGEERELIDIQPEAAVPELLKNEEEEAAAAAEIEHGLRRAAMEFQILSADDVQPQPALHVGVLGVVIFRGSVLRLDRRQPRLVDPGIDRPETDRMNNALDSAPGAPIGQRLRELRDFMGKLHPKGGSQD